MRILLQSLVVAALSFSCTAFSPSVPYTTLKSFSISQRSHIALQQDTRKSSPIPLAPKSPRSQLRISSVRTLRCKEGGDGDKKPGLVTKLGVPLASSALACSLFFSAPQPLADWTEKLLAVKNEIVAVTERKGVLAFSEESDARLQPNEKNLIRLFRENTPSVVFISTFTNQQNSFSRNIEEMPRGTGSGFVWDKQGHIVTNFHVINGANSAQVALTTVGGKQTNYRAELTGADPDKDIAVLKIDAPESVLRPISVGSSGDVQVGQTALAIGNPFGLDHTLTQGIISGLGRETKSPTGRPISNVIQTDAAINPGNSGGALLDSQGQLIGMNTAIFSPSGASAGIGFAIPSDTIQVIVDQIIRTGGVVRPAIGISFLDAAQSTQLGIPPGVLVLETGRDSPAAQAGIRGTVRSMRGVELGDIIIGVNENDVKSEKELFAVLENFEPGQEITLKILRYEDGNLIPKKLKLTLGAASRAVSGQLKK